MVGRAFAALLLVALTAVPAFGGDVIIRTRPVYVAPPVYVNPPVVYTPPAVVYGGPVAPAYGVVYRRHRHAWYGRVYVGGPGFVAYGRLW